MSFDALIAPLRDLAADIGFDGNEPAAGRVPFQLVVTRQVVPIERAMPQTTLHGKHKPGFVDRSFEPGALERFVATKDAALPNPHAYLLVDIDRGEEFCGVIPHDAMVTIARRGRTPLTIEEGIALITHFPQILVKNKCFSLGGSRASTPPPNSPIDRPVAENLLIRILQHKSFQCLIIVNNRIDIAGLSSKFCLIYR